MNDDAAAVLAAARRAGVCCDLPLNELKDRSSAESFQAAATKALGGKMCGYKIGATSLEVQRLLKSEQPIYAPILESDVFPGGANFRLPEGSLGIECEFGFVMGRDFPLPRDVINIETLTSRIADCFVALELVGRRVTEKVPLTEASAIADFSLHAAVIRGASIPNWDRMDLAQIPVRAVLDGATVREGTGALVLGHPLKALLWLAEALYDRGERLKPGHIVLTGTCTGVTKVSPGQTFAGQFAQLPPVTVSFSR